MITRWLENHRRRGRLRLVEQNVRATRYFEELAVFLSRPGLAEQARQAGGDLHVVQFCVEDSGTLDPVTERRQVQINRDLRRSYRKIRGNLKSSFDTFFRPKDGWEPFYRMRGL